MIEILSRSNKSGLGRGQYLQKRRELLDQPVHLVEVDLLLGGKRLPMGGRLPAGEYYAFVSRAEKRESSDVYAWSIRRPMPAIPIPLVSARPGSQSGPRRGCQSGLRTGPPSPPDPLRRPAGLALDR